MKQNILFQGDSITDCKRLETADGLGNNGYVKQIANENIFNTVTNRGISGNGLLNMLCRWQKDAIDVQPDILSILIGVNDVLHELRDKDGVDSILFYDVYDIILKNTHRMLPNTQIIVMSPFVLDVENPNIPDFPLFREKLNKIIHVVFELSTKYRLKYIPLQEIFDEKLSEYKKEELTIDGIHPTELGHTIIKEAFLEAYKK